MRKPRIDSKPFYLAFSADHFRKNELLKLSNGHMVRVLKAYRNTRWRRFLKWIGFNVRMHQIKVVTHTFPINWTKESKR